MSTDLKLEALRLATSLQVADRIGDAVDYAAKMFEFLTGNSVAAPAGKQTKAVKEANAAPTKDAPAATETPKTEAAKVETPKQPEAPAVTMEEVKQAVIGLVNAGNKAAGNDKTGREYAAAVLQPFGAKNVSTIKPEDYAKVVEALKAKQKAVEEEAALTG
jgi:hypothetical protein